MQESLEYASLPRRFGRLHLLIVIAAAGGLLCLLLALTFTSHIGRLNMHGEARFALYLLLHAASAAAALFATGAAAVSIYLRRATRLIYVSLVTSTMILLFYLVISLTIYIHG